MHVHGLAVPYTTKLHIAKVALLYKPFMFASVYASAWTKVELMKQYEEHKEQLSTSYKRTNFLEAVKDIEQAFDRRSKGDVRAVKIV